MSAEIEELRRQLEEARAEVRTTRFMFQLAMDNIPQSIFWKDRESRIAGCNQSFADMVGRPNPTEVVGLTDFDFNCTPDEAACYQAVDALVMETDSPVYRHLETLLHPSEGSRVLETNKIPLKNVTGEVIGLLGTFEDVTQRQQLQEELRRHRDHLELLVIERTQELEMEVEERHRAEATLEQRNQELHAAERAKSEFFANISHELRTPLTLILAPLESLLSGALPDPLWRTLETVHNNGLRLLDLVNQLLDFARLEAGQLVVCRSPLDVVGLTERLVADVQPLAQAREQTVHVQLRLADPNRNLDPYLYERILLNLLSNALKFTPTGGRVGVEVTQAGEELALTVWDEGIGISDEDQRRLFKRFQQAESSSTRRFEGTGLGLAMVRDFARLLGGEVRLQSTPGKGSRFTVSLEAPVTERALPALPSATRHARAASVEAPAAQAPANAPEILIAEDNPELAAYLGELLAPLYRLRFARDGQEALEEISLKAPDLVLSDVMMPRRDGISLCQALKASPVTCGIPVMLLTALTLRRSLLEGWEAGADEYLFKPFHPVELMTRVRALIEGRRLRQQVDAERRQLEARLAELQRQEGLSLMAGGIAHDFNNLLAVILGNLNLAQADLGDRELVMDSLREADAAANRAADLTRQMLTYSGRAPTRVQSLDLATVVEDTAHQAVRGLARRAELEMTLLPAPVKGDPTQLRQVLMNLVHNGVEAVPEGRVPRLRVASGVDNFSKEFLRDQGNPGRYSYLKVEDDGCGMDEETSRRMFEPFYSTKALGRGLGLASVLGIVKAHDGGLRVFTQLDRGTTIWMVLPVDAAVALSSVRTNGPGRVLIVDDEESVRRTMVRMVRKLGFDVVEAASGREGVELFEQHRHDLSAVFLDVLLPDLDGREVARQMRSFAECPPLIYCSGYWGGDPTPEPGTSVLVKPFDLTSLSQTLQEVLGG